MVDASHDSGCKTELLGVIAFSLAYLINAASKERNSLPEDVDTNVYNLFHFRWVRRKAGGELSGN